jgi:ribonucleoside-diphosphate reductase alpha chain
LLNFNLSVGVSDAFLKAYRKERDYELINPVDGRSVGRISARKIFDMIVESAWQTGDPGLIFLDTINRSYPTPHLGAIEATNPCGEIPLLPFESCNLGSINLSHMLHKGKNVIGIDWEKLRRVTKEAARFLDDVIEVSRYPIPEIERVTRGNRKIGLGVMGFAEMLIRLHIPYDSDEAVRTADRIMEVLSWEARKSSRVLARERGGPKLERQHL